MCFFMCQTGGKNWKGVWNSDGKRYKVSRFRCDFCNRIKKGQSYSIVDGGKSCINCDKDDDGGTFIGNCTSYT